MDEKFVSILKYLRLRNLLDRWEEYMAMARKKRMSVERLMTLVLEEEYVAKCDNARLLRRQRTHIPEILEIETFPFAKQPKLDRKKIMSYYDGFNYTHGYATAAFTAGTTLDPVFGFGHEFVQRGGVRIGIEAPSDMAVIRQELKDQQEEAARQPVRASES